MSDHPTDHGHKDEDRDDNSTGGSQHVAEQHTTSEPGKAADLETIPGEKPKDDPDEDGEDRFDAG